MKNRARKLLCAVLLLALTIPMLTLSAYATLDDAKVGEYFQWCIDQTPASGEAKDQIVSAVITAGSCPGISVWTQTDAVWLGGTPGAAGVYNFTVHISYGDGSSWDCTPRLTVSEAQKVVTDFSGSVKITQGTPVSELHVVSVDSMIQSSSLVSGSLPAGISATQYDTYFTLSGTASVSGSFSAKYHCETEGGECYATLNVTVDPPAAVPLKVTKSPTGETVTEGESAMFISAAEGYSDVEWRIVPEKGSPVWRGKKEIESAFPGVVVKISQDKDGRETLVLSKIPLSLNGFYVQTKFWSTDKSETALTADKSAQLVVKPMELLSPVITLQPKSAELQTGETTVLTVAANDPNDGTLRYQWYSSAQNTNIGGKLIPGETSASFTPPQSEGESYYYAVVTPKKDDRTGAGVASEVACVSYPVTPSATAEIEPTAEPTSAPTPVPTASATPSPAPVQPEKQEKSGLGFIFVLAIALILAAAGVIVYILLKNRKRGEEDAPSIFDDAPYPEKRAARKTAKPAPIAYKAGKGWDCTFCGTHNLGSFCTDCGAKKPAGAVQYACDKCGWEPDDPSDPPHFCPNCGDRFCEEDIVR